MRFKVTTEGIDRLGLVEICQRIADQQWLPAHMLSHEAAESVLDAFKRTRRHRRLTTRNTSNKLLRVEGQRNILLEQFTDL
jgi:hypothetical protein